MDGALIIFVACALHCTGPTLPSLQVHFTALGRPYLRYKYTSLHWADLAFITSTLHCTGPTLPSLHVRFTALNRPCLRYTYALPHWTDLAFVTRTLHRTEPTLPSLCNSVKINLNQRIDGKWIVCVAIILWIRENGCSQSAASLNHDHLHKSFVAIRYNIASYTNRALVTVNNMISLIIQAIKTDKR